MKVQIELETHEVLKLCNLLANRAEFLLRTEKTISAGYYLEIHEKLLAVIKTPKTE